MSAVFLNDSYIYMENKMQDKKLMTITVVSVVVIAISAFVMFNLSSSGIASADLKVDKNSEQSKLGYALGYRVMQDLKRSGVTDEIDLNGFLAGQSDVFNDAEAQLTAEEMTEVVNNYQVRLREEAVALAEKNLESSKAFIEKNKTEEGIKETKTGLQYKVVREGTGKKPGKDSTVVVHYRGTLIDGTMFDSSYKRGEAAEFPVNGVVPGFGEGIQLMKEGAKFLFLIPPDLAYGVNAPPAIGPNQALIFEVELVTVK